MSEALIKKLNAISHGNLSDPMFVRMDDWNEAVEEVRSVLTELNRLQSEVERLRGRLAEFGDRITYGVLVQGEFVGYEDGYDDAIELAEECGGAVFGIYAQRLRQQAAESAK